ncbi:TRAP-type mannitol/chloroaromatic compound transport system, periplasmic component [Rivularia sp. PCC 7116]|uniref:TRAP transporter substrate-binding protein DctP n=1 Tax=Rivularia sp. PCC 7116 TaxID=373994 RepID=UPI00029F2C3A|nr:TRAP transporter substrate-binding protein DctP [Rivularia sp. PCC 7116]AFY58922.1 TRAP-type mannitol/chloroaromatic compound transport system, periplasmic component [Rivularia sp. PCC 7116]
MKRREIIKKAAIATATTATIASCSRGGNTTTAGTSLPKVRWRMATSWPESLIIYTGPETIANRVKEMTDGRFTITPAAAGELTGATEVLDAVQTGSVQCGHTASYFYIGKNPALAFATSIPFGLTPQQQNAWLYHGDGQKMIQEIYDKFNIVYFPAGNSGTQMGGWFKREIKSLADLRGLKMRIPGLGGKVMARLGVNVQVLPGGEIYLALERGAIDAAEWIGPYDDEKLGLNKAAPFYYYPGWWEPGSTLDVLVNRGAWEKLPEEYKQIFKTAAYEANMDMLARYEALNGEALTKLTQSGTKLVAYSDEILQAAQKATIEELEASASKDATFKKVYEQWKGFRDKLYNWNRVNELSFANFVTKE